MTTILRSAAALAFAFALAAGAQQPTPEAKPPEAPADKPADAPPASPPDTPKPAEAPPPGEEPTQGTPKAAAKDAPAAGTVKADEPGGTKDCNVESVHKALDEAAAAIKGNPAFGKAGGQFRKALAQISAAGKSVDRACAAAKKGGRKGKSMKGGGK